MPVLGSLILPLSPAVMETHRNNRAIGDPVPAQPKHGKHRVRKDKNYCNRLKGEHSVVLDDWIGRYGGWFRHIITVCTACGKKEWHHMDSPEQEQRFLRNLDRAR